MKNKKVMRFVVLADFGFFILVAVNMCFVARDESLIEAAGNGDLTEVKRLVKAGVDINYEFENGCFNPLNAAISNHQRETAQWLVDHGGTLGQHDECKKETFNKEWDPILAKARQNERK